MRGRKGKRGRGRGRRGVSEDSAGFRRREGAAVKENGGCVENVTEENDGLIVGGVGNVEADEMDGVGGNSGSNGECQPEEGDLGLQIKVADCLEQRKSEALDDTKCVFDLGTVECQKDVDLMCISSVEEEQGSQKRRCISKKLKTSITPLRRSARRAAILDSVSSLNDDVIGSAEKTCNASADMSTKSISDIILQLPPSSKDPNLDGLPVLDVFSVYSCLRSFSTLLFSSPFSLDAFVGSMRCNFANSLIDSVHFSILHTLKGHLEHLAAEGSLSASNCLRALNWGLLDLVTWPVYLTEYLLLHGSFIKPGFKLASVKLLDGDYYRLSAATKLDILRCLCDDVVEADVVRLELRRRMLDADPDSENEHNTSYEDQNKEFSLNDVQSSPSQDSDVEAADPNHDECCLCKMDGSLICCDGCPAAFHSRCVGVARDTLPEGDWYCPECLVREVDQPVKPSKTFHGAELLGVDINGHLFFGSCGYLLVSKSSDANSYCYYNRNDLQYVVEILITSSRTVYADIIAAIKNCWGIGNGSACSGYEACGVKESCCDISLMHTTPSFSRSKFSSIFSNNLPGVHCPSKFSDTFVENPQSATVHSGGVDSLTNSTNYIKEEGLSSKITEEMKRCDTQVKSEQSSYVNFYSFGRVASSFAEEITYKSPEDNHDLKTSPVDEISAQLNMISKKMMNFGWSLIQKLSLDAQREPCGWCSSCKSPDNQDCLVNITGTKLFEAHNYSADELLIEDGKGHMITALHDCLTIEDNLHGLLSGPWEDPCYREHWRNSVLAANIASLKHLLLTLESNIRRVTLLTEWVKPVDSVLTVGSACHSVSSLPQTSKKLGVRRRARKSTAEGKKSSFDASVDFDSHVASTSGIYWWRGGKLSRQLFSWKMLPRSMVIKCGRQAGCKKIPGIYYPDGSEIAKRSRYVAWRAAVEMSNSVAQLIFHVKDLSSNIRWNDLKNTQIFSCLAKENKKLVKPLKNVIVRRKLVEKNQVNYVLDFGRKKNIPDMITMQALKHQETSSGRKQYWLSERVIPLGLLKAFELKRLGYKDKKVNKKVCYDEVGKPKAIKRKISSIFVHLFSKIPSMEYHKCGQCDEDIIESDVASCEFCGGFFHKEHFNLPKGAIDIAYMCRSCENKKTAKLKRKEEKRKAKETSKLKRKEEKRKAKETAKLEGKEEKRKVSIRLKVKNQEKKAAIKLKVRKLRQKAAKLKFKKQKEKSKFKISGKKNHSKRDKGEAVANSKSLSENEKIPAMNCHYTLRSKRHKNLPIERGFEKTWNSIHWYQRRHKNLSIERGFEKTWNSIHWYQRTRTSSHHSYWLNGLLWSQKEGYERGVHFRSTKVFMPFSHSSNPGFNPTCAICHEEHNPDLIYLSCENCGDWVHGGAVGITIENIKGVSGFVCHKCLSKPTPLCPYVGEPIREVTPLRVRNDEVGDGDDVFLPKDNEQDLHDTNCELLNIIHCRDEQRKESNMVIVTDDCLFGNSKVRTEECGEKDLLQTNSNELYNKISVDDEVMTEATDNAEQRVNNYKDSSDNHIFPLVVAGTSFNVNLPEDSNLQIESDKARFGEYSGKDLLQTDSNLLHIGEALNDELMAESNADAKNNFVNYGNSSENYSVPCVEGFTADYVHLLDDTQLHNGDDEAEIKEYREQGSQRFNSDAFHIVDSVDDEVMTEATAVVNQSVDSIDNEIMTLRTADVDQHLINCKTISANPCSIRHVVPGNADHIHYLDDTQPQSQEDLGQEILESQCKPFCVRDSANDGGCRDAILNENSFIHGDHLERFDTGVDCNPLQTGYSADKQMSETIPE